MTTEPLRVGQRVRHMTRRWVFGELICFDEDYERALVSGHGWQKPSDLKPLPTPSAGTNGEEEHECCDHDKAGMDAEIRHWKTRAEAAEAVVAQQSPTLPFVLRLASHMEKKLAANRHKGDADGWRRLSRARLFEMIHGELDELATSVVSREGEDAAWDEAADVANIAMMIADGYSHKEAALAARQQAGEVGNGKEKNKESNMKTVEELNQMSQEMVLTVTGDMDEHPEGYDGPCACRLCCSYDGEIAE